MTDLVVCITERPIDVIPSECLLDLARNDGLNASIAGDLTKEQIAERTVKGPVSDTPENRRIGKVTTAKHASN